MNERIDIEEIDDGGGELFCLGCEAELTDSEIENGDYCWECEEEAAESDGL